MKRRLLAAAVLLGILWGPARAQPSPHAMGLADLLGTVDGAVEQIAQEADRNPALGPKVPRLKPFFLALKRLKDSSVALHQALVAKDQAAYLRSLEQLGQATEELKVAAYLGGIHAQPVKRALQSLDASVELLQTRFGWAAARTRSGGQLSQQERAELAELRERTRVMAQQLEELRARVQASGGDARLIAGLQDMVERARRVGNSRGDGLVDFLVGLNVVDALTGRWRGLYDYYVVVDPGYLNWLRPYDPWWNQVDDWYDRVYQDYTWSDWTYLEQHTINLNETTWQDLSVGPSDWNRYEQYIDEQAATAESRSGDDWEVKNSDLDRDEPSLGEGVGSFESERFDDGGGLDGPGMDIGE